MSQFINATVENGILKPDRDLGLASGIKVRVTVEPCEDAVAQAKLAYDELDQLCEELPIARELPLQVRPALVVPAFLVDPSVAVAPLG